jgi:hypothetical protein
MKKMEISLALALLATTTAVAQNTQPAQQEIQPPPVQWPPQGQAPPPAPAAPAQATPPAAAPPPPQQIQPPPVQTGTPQSPPPARYPATQNQPPPVQPSPPPQQYPVQPVQPAQPTYVRPQWVHSESDYPGRPQPPENGFHYHPFRLQIDGGGTITQQTNDKDLDNGWNAGLGLTWFPTSLLPLGIRVDGTYNHFNARTPLLQQASATYGTLVNNGTERVYGGDVDLELDLNFSYYWRMYLLAGGGWYREQDTFRQFNYNGAVFCGWWGCGPGYVGTRSIVARNTTDWQFAKNAGLGFEFAMGPRASFFVEARYMRINPNNAKDDFLPIRAGLRF